MNMVVIMVRMMGIMRMSWMHLQLGLELPLLKLRLMEVAVIIIMVMYPLLVQLVTFGVRIIQLRISSIIRLVMAMALRMSTSMMLTLRPMEVMESIRTTVMVKRKMLVRKRKRERVQFIL